MTCRLITSPITGKEETSKTWSDIRNLVESDTEADKLYSQLVSPEFINWFGDWVNDPNGENTSKVVNELGEPLVVYHGSNNIFEEFNKNLSGDKTGWAKEYKGIHFFENKSSAETYYQSIDNIDIQTDIFSFYLMQDKKDKKISKKEFDNLKEKNQNIGQILHEYNLNHFKYSYGMSYEEYNDLYKKYGHDKNLINTEYEDEVFNLMDNYSKPKEELYSVFLNIKTPLIHNSEGKRYVQEIKEIYSKLDNNDGLIVNNTLDRLNDSIGFEDNLYVAFNSNQIKSITNNGKFSSSDNIYNSIENTESSKASPKTIEKVKEFLQRLSIEVKTLDTERYGGINGVAKILENVIEIAQGKENIALAEEASHFITEIIKLQNPALYKQMLNKIGSYNLYKDTLSIYGQNKNYQNEDGSPNILKIKEEAIGKVLAEYYIKSEEGITEKPELLKQTNGWWEQIKSFFLGLIGKAGFNPFEETIKDLATYEKLNAAKTIVDRIDLAQMKGIFGPIFQEYKDKGEYGPIIQFLKEQLSDPLSYVQTVDSVLAGDFKLANEILDKEYYSIAPNKAVDDAYNKFIEESKKIVLVGQGTDDRHYTYNGERVAISVTKMLDEKDKGKFAPRVGNDKIGDDSKKYWGSEGHEYLAEYAQKNLIDENGYARPTALNKSITTKLPTNLQKILRDYITELIKSYPIGTRFAIEKAVINKKVKGMMASTIDFQAFIPDTNTGLKVDTLDWKFLDLNLNKFEDIPWYKDTKWKGQMAEYNTINKQYGITDKQLRKTRMVPFIATYVPVKKGEPSQGLKLTGVQIGNIDTAKETKTYLLPVPSPEESSGNEKVDELVKKLQGQYKKLSEKFVEEKDRPDKVKQLEQLSKAIRKLHLQINFDPLEAEAKTFVKSIDKVLEKYASTDFSKLEREVISNIGEELLELKASASIYADLNQTFLDVFPAESFTKEEAEKAAFFDKLAQTSNRRIESIQQLQNKLAAGLAVQEGLVNTLDINKAQEIITTPEKEIIGWVNKNFTEGSKMPSRIIQLSKRLFTVKKSAQAQQEKELGNRFAKLLPDFFEATKGFKSPLDAVKRKTSHKLIAKYDKAFYEAMEKAWKDGDKKWLLTNVDITEYNKAVQERVDEFTKNIEEESIDPQEQDRQIQKIVDSLDLESDSFNGFYDPSFQYYYNRFSKKEEHLSPEYLKMAENPAILKVWEFLTSLNEIGVEIGYTNSRSFLPFIEGTIIEQMNQSSNVFKTSKELLKQGYVLNINERAYNAKINSETGEVERSIPRLFTRKSDNLEDTSYSQDLTKLVGPWINAMLSYKTSSELEYIMQTLQEVENNKDHLQLDPFKNEIIFEQGSPKKFAGNIKNAAILEKTIDDDIYFTQEKSDTYIDIAVDKLGKGTDEEKTTKKLQTKKIGKNLNQWTAMLATGAKLMVSIPNYVGVNFQAVINSGNFYTWSDYLKNTTKVIGGAVPFANLGLTLVDKALIDMIHPLNEDVALENKRKFSKKESTLSWLSTWSFNDVMHSMNRIGELANEYANALSFNDNSIIEGGKIVNIRQYLSKIDNKYGITEAERKVLEKSFESRVKELQNTRSLSKTIKFNEQGEIEIPVSAEELAKYRTLVTEFARNNSGKTSRDNKADWERSVIMKSFMMFKGWIPKQVDLRGADIRKNNELNSWEYGRTRLFAKTWHHLGLRRTMEMRDIIKGTEKGLSIMREILEEKKEKYYKATGQELEISEAEFFDMMRKELHSQSKELVMLLTMLSFFFASKLAAPDKDDDELAQNRYKWWRKLLNKITSELDFYYNPTSADSITRGSIIPSLSLLTKVEKLMGAIIKESYGITTEDKELEDKTYPVKYFLNLVPGASQYINEILPATYPEGAKYLGVRFSEQARVGQ